MLGNVLIYQIILDSGWLSCFPFTVTPSTSGQYEGKSKNVTFYPTIGLQYTTFHKGIDPKVRVIQCNMVNEEDFWRLKVILSRHVIKKLFYPKNGLDGATMGTSQSKNSKCIGSNMVNHAQDWSWVKKFINLPNKLIPTIYLTNDLFFDLVTIQAPWTTDYADGADMQSLHCFMLCWCSVWAAAVCPFSVVTWMGGDLAPALTLFNIAQFICLQF